MTEECKTLTRKTLIQLAGGLLVVAVVCAILGLMLGGSWAFFYIIALVMLILSIAVFFISKKYPEQ